MKLAVFTDIHGNLEALKTIINDINFFIILSYLSSKTAFQLNTLMKYGR